MAVYEELIDTTDKDLVIKNPSVWLLIRPNKKNKCVSGNGSENFRWGRHTYFYFFIYFYF